MDNNQNNKTQLETNKTQIESSKTQIEGANTISSITLNDKFRDYEIVKQLPTSGAEADIYLIQKDNQNYILKLYRHELKPSEELVEKLLRLSQKYPEDIVKIYEIAFDEQTQRWYEIQEYAKYGSLRDAILHDTNFLKANLNKIIKEISLLLKTIHSEHIIHRDIKPENILIRSRYPLDLIITDFGISSILETDFSKKLTSKSGTRVYFSPESFTGIIGTEVDYWAFGMILLEILEGDNIFGGEKDEAKIIYQITVLGIKIPDNIDKRVQNLLKGLLTKNPKKRWGESEIEKWLNGEDNIPIYYEIIEDNPSRDYTFKGKHFSNIKDLLQFIYKEENYIDAKEHIMRGYITKWLEQNNFFDEALELDRLKNSDTNIDINIFLIFNHFVKLKDFIFMGKKITLQNLLIYTQKIIDKQEDSYQIETNIVEYLLSGVLHRAYKSFSSEFSSDLYNVLLYSQAAQNHEELFALLQMFINKKIAYSVVLNNKENKIITNGNLQKLYALLDTDNYILPKKQQELLERGEFEKFELLDYYIPKKDFEEFLQNKDMFGLYDVTLKLVRENSISYEQVAKIVARSANMESFQEFADIYRDFSRIKDSKYITNNKLKDELQMKIIDSVQPLSKNDVKDIKNKLKQLKDNIDDVKEFRRKQSILNTIDLINKKKFKLAFQISYSIWIFALFYLKDWAGNTGDYIAGVIVGGFILANIAAVIILYPIISIIAAIIIFILELSL